MRSAFLLLVLPLLLSLNPPSKKKLSKEILGAWSMMFHVNKGVVTDSYYVKTQKTDHHFNGFEFSKSGYLIFNVQTTFSETEPNEFESIKGSWDLLNDSMVTVQYKFGNQLMTEKLFYSENKNGEAVLKMIE